MSILSAWLTRLWQPCVFTNQPHKYLPSRRRERAPVISGQCSTRSRPVKGYEWQVIPPIFAKTCFFDAAAYRKCKPSRSRKMIEHNIPSLPAPSPPAAISRATFPSTSFRDSRTKSVFVQSTYNGSDNGAFLAVVAVPAINALRESAPLQKVEAECGAVSVRLRRAQQESGAEGK